MKQTTSGFTIVELLITIVVIGIIASITLLSFSNVQVRANDAVIRQG
ncbi:prepilin-type N-terminal cleavage/methylation domain-containing protein, partial [Candidatus Saccharibacteria bacterium]|nr:prepilin-type N-terminal cleavage/methylation domain-containing protein [Candidatus Saccharibacteria bacterium]